jgi:serine/threonine protein kinase
MMPDGAESTVRVGAPADTAPPQVPDHEILQKIGRGAYGEVWLARNVMGTFRAVKVIYRDRFEDAAPYEREFEGIRKFEPISRSHDGLVDILQIGRNDAAGYFYYIMELADDRKHGQTIDPEVYVPRTLPTKDRLPVDTCIEYGLSLADALRHLHDNRLIHRDVKPANIIFVRDVPKLADIGLVTDAGAEGTLVGTPGFFSPEDAGTPQADIYSLGKVLYQITMGKDPRDFPDPLADLAQLPEQAKLLGMNAIILKACRTGVRGRYSSVQEMHQDLLALRDGASPKPLKRAILAVSACILGALIFWGSWQLTHRSDTQQSVIPNIPSTVVSPSPPNTLSAEEIAAGFKLLFNGTNLIGWLAPSNNWQVQDGSIARISNGGDIEYRVEQVPDDFELRFEWKIERGSHSAIHYRPGNYQYHIVDNLNVRPPEGRKLAGALWGVAGPVNAGMKPVGQWNEARILCKGTVIEHWLNGERVVAIDYAKPEWKPIVRGFQQRSHTKLAARGGYLKLQDRNGAVSFRSLRWKKLE